MYTSTRTKTNSPFNTHTFGSSRRIPQHDHLVSRQESFISLCDDCDIGPDLLEHWQTSEEMEPTRNTRQLDINCRFNWPLGTKMAKNSIGEKNDVTQLPCVQVILL
jgi:hypothetical protein